MASMRRLRVLTACLAGAATASSSADAPTSAADSPARHRVFTDAELDSFANEVKRTGSAILRGVLDREKLKAIRNDYASVLAARIERAGPDRGPGR
jgi:hypothetical protein